MFDNLSRDDALKLLERIQHLINSSEEDDFSKAISFNLIKIEFDKALHKPQEERMRAFEVITDLGKTEIVFAASKSKAKNESDAHSDGNTFFSLRVKRRPDLDQYVESGLPDNFDITKRPE